MKMVFIGQAPGPNTAPHRPLGIETATGRRLCSISGLAPDEYENLTMRVNLLQSFPGSWKNGDAFPMATAKVAAQAIIPFLEGRHVVLVGRNVANAFGFIDDSQFMRWYKAKAGELEFSYSVIPHPSGRNHWYHRPENRATAESFWNSLRMMVRTVTL